MFESLIHFGLVVEDFHQEEAAFITSRSYNKDAFDIPWMIGVTSDEFIGFTDKCKFDI